MLASSKNNASSNEAELLLDQESEGITLIQINYVAGPRSKKLQILYYTKGKIYQKNILHSKRSMND